MKETMKNKKKYNEPEMKLVELACRENRLLCESGDNCDENGYAPELFKQDPIA